MSTEILPAPKISQHDQGDNEKREGSGSNKLVRIGEEREQRLPVPDYVSHGQVNGEYEARDPGKEAQSEEDATKELDASDEDRHLRWHRQA